MANSIDAGPVRIAAYLAATAMALIWGWREHRSPNRGALRLWPTYWWLSSALLGAMTVAVVGGLGDLVGELGREQARHAGWYDGRRGVQAAAVIAIAGTWLVGLVIAVWRVPRRRRRYLPHAIGLSGVVTFAAARVISLHQLDAVVYRRQLAGVRVVAVCELLLLAATIALGMWGARFRDDRDPPSDPPSDRPRTAGDSDPVGRFSRSSTPSPATNHRHLG